MKIAEHQRHPNLGLQLAMEEVAIAVREIAIEIEVKRQVGLAYNAVRPASDVLQNFIAKLGKQRPNVTRAKPVARIKR